MSARQSGGPPDRRNGPAGNGTESEKLLGGGYRGHDTPVDAAAWEELAAHVDGAFVVLVHTNAGRYRRRVWMTLAPAERAAEKARAAGHNATVLLAQLKPLHRVVGGEVR